jgi:hypothetical protein
MSKLPAPQRAIRSAAIKRPKVRGKKSQMKEHKLNKGESVLELEGLLKVTYPETPFYQTAFTGLLTFDFWSNFMILR